MRSSIQKSAMVAAIAIGFAAVAAAPAQAVPLPDPHVSIPSFDVIKPPKRPVFTLPPVSPPTVDPGVVDPGVAPTEPPSADPTPTKPPKNTNGDQANSGSGGTVTEPFSGQPDTAEDVSVFSPINPDGAAAAEQSQRAPALLVFGIAAIGLLLLAGVAALGWLAVRGRQS